jgi:hypothetical protein
MISFTGSPVRPFTGFSQSFQGRKAADIWSDFFLGSFGHLTASTPERSIITT